MSSLSTVTIEWPPLAVTRVSPRAAPSPSTAKTKKKKLRSWLWFHHFMANKWGQNGNSETLFSWAPKLEDRRRRGRQRMGWLDGTFSSMDMSVRWLRTGKPGMLQSMGSQRVGHN